MIRFYINLGDSFSFWSVLSSITGIVLAAVAIFTYVHTIRSRRKDEKQKYEDERARLDFSIVERKNKYQLRITNIGKMAAYDVRLKFNTDFIETIYLGDVVWGWKNIQETSFSIEAGHSLFLPITEVCSAEDLKFYSEYKNEELEHIGRLDILWMKLNSEKKLHIEYHYNNSYNNTLFISVAQFIIPGVEKVENPINDTLIQISNGIGNDSYSPTIQNSLMYISRSYKQQQRLDMFNRDFGPLLNENKKSQLKNSKNSKKKKK